MLTSLNFSPCRLKSWRKKVTIRLWSDENCSAGKVAVLQLAIKVTKAGSAKYREQFQLLFFPAIHLTLYFYLLIRYSKSLSSNMTKLGGLRDDQFPYFAHTIPSSFLNSKTCQVPLFLSSIREFGEIFNNIINFWIPLNFPVSKPTFSFKYKYLHLTHSISYDHIGCRLSGTPPKIYNHGGQVKSVEIFRFDSEFFGTISNHFNRF